MTGDLFSEFTWLITLLIVGYICGKVAEIRHYRSINRREKSSIGRALVTFESGFSEQDCRQGVLVVGSVVISTDYFKRFVAFLRNIFGGRISSYESLVDRARREALLRMKESKPDADLFVNVRIETSSIGKSGNRRKMVASVEAIAYGTAVYLKDAREALCANQ